MQDIGKTTPTLCYLLHVNTGYADEAATEVTSAMMPLSSTGSVLAFTALGDWGKVSDTQKAVATALGRWSDKHNSAFTAAIGELQAGVKRSAP